MEASMAGVFPYWIELEMRDLPLSPQASQKLFELQSADKDLPKGLAWFFVTESKPLRLPIQFGNSRDAGTLLVNCSTSHCMSHDRFVMRILDPEGRVLWKDEATALADSRFAIVDLDDDWLHEILLDRNDHGDRATFKITCPSRAALFPKETEPKVDASPDGVATDPFAPDSSGSPKK